MRPIDIDKLKDLEELEYKYFRSPAAVPFYEADKVWEILEAAPTLTYEDLVPHGEWEFEHENWGKLTCSLCKGEALKNSIPSFYGNTITYVGSNFCPNCGAKMNRRVDNEND